MNVPLVRQYLTDTICLFLRIESLGKPFCPVLDIKETFAEMIYHGENFSLTDIPDTVNIGIC